MLNMIKWSLLLWVGVMLGLIAFPFILLFYVGKGCMLGFIATWRHMRSYMGQIKYDFSNNVRRK